MGWRELDKIPLTIANLMEQSMNDEYIKTDDLFTTEQERQEVSLEKVVK